MKIERNEKQTAFFAKVDALKTAKCDKRNAKTVLLAGGWNVTLQ